MTTYYGKEYNETGYAYKATMEFLYGRDGLFRADNKLRTYQNLLESEPYTPYLDTFNVTGLINWYHHPRMINESLEVNAEQNFTYGSSDEFVNFGSTAIFYPNPDPEIFAFELNRQIHSRVKGFYGDNTLSARTLKPKHFAYYYKHFDRMDREYGKIFDLKTGRMYPEAKEKFWPDAIDNIGITKPGYVNPRLKPENWRTEKRMASTKGQDVRFFSPWGRAVGMCPPDNPPPYPYSCS